MKLSARMEPFDTFWEAPKDVEKGYSSFLKFYKRNYLRHIPENKSINILVVSCGPGYFVNLLNKEGYKNVYGIDSDADKVKFALEKDLRCENHEAFAFLANHNDQYDVIFAEQEINHLTIEEALKFFDLCKNSLKKGGLLIIHSINGANPITGIESLTQNIDHFNSFTEYSLKQILELAGLQEIKIIPLNLYVFFENPLNYVGLLIDKILSLIFMLTFMFYGKSNKIFTKKIAAIGRKIV
jgi:SAM-dependent methyltransferase